MIEKLPSKRAQRARKAPASPTAVLCYECLRPQGAHSPLELRRCRIALSARVEAEGVTPAC